jgi:tRNA nucleotidyltransferase (CCA-adding enzyme)
VTDTATLPRWTRFAHDADIGIRGYGGTLAEAFEQAALALTSVVASSEVNAIERVDVVCHRADLELLFVDWLDAIIYQMAVKRMLFGRYSVQISGSELAGTLWGERVDVQRHAPACEPKGATLTALKVAQNPDGSWEAGCVIDV